MQCDKVQVLVNILYKWNFKMKCISKSIVTWRQSQWKGFVLTIIDNLFSMQGFRSAALATKYASYDKNIKQEIEIGEKDELKGRNVVFSPSLRT